MNTIDLKKILISEITEIDDEIFLSALKTILDSRRNAKNYYEQYNDELKVAENDIQSGNFYSHSEIKDKIEQWKKK